MPCFKSTLEYFCTSFYLPIFLQSTPINFEATPCITAASPAGVTVPLPQPVWDPYLNAWQPCLEPEACLPFPVNTSALTPLSESSSTAVVKVPILYTIAPFLRTAFNRFLIFSGPARSSPSPSSLTQGLQPYLDGSFNNGL